MLIRRSRLAAALLLLLLAACRTTPPVAPGTPIPWSLRRPQLQSQQHFELKARIAVAAGETGSNANLRWQQEGDRSQVAIEGPLGVGGLQLTLAGADLEIRTARGEHIGNEQARAELRNRLGFDVPVASLRYWILGVPDPAQPAEETLDASGQRLAALEQSGWHVAYGSYGSWSGEALPARLTLEREAVRVKLVADDWRL